MGEKQKALDYYSQALSFFRDGRNRLGESSVLMSIGSVYESLGEYTKALKNFEQGLLIAQSINHSRVQAQALFNIGSVYAGLGDSQKAVDFFNKALTIYRATKNSRGEALTLTNIAGIYEKQADYKRALEYNNLALSLFQRYGERSLEAVSLSTLGRIHSIVGETETAFKYLDQALSINRAIADQPGEVVTLYGLALVEQRRNNLMQSLSHIEAALSKVERLRTKVISQDLRGSYLSTTQPYYQLHTDVLMRLHEQDPAKGFDATALEVSERGRARSLLELLAEAHADIRQGVDPNLLEQERILLQVIGSKREGLIRLLSGKYIEEQAAAARKELDELTSEYEQVAARIRATSPGYAALTQPQPLTAKQIQKELDPDTILLEYSLGEERSYLWVITHNTLSTYKLANRAEIEEAAKEFYTLLTSGRDVYSGGVRRGADLLQGTSAEDRWAAQTANRLSQIVLGPVAKHLGGKRLVVVADGALQLIPFAALPDPAKLKGGKNTEPLVMSHEIVHLPSASTIAIQRQQISGRRPAEKTLSVIADPVFDAADPRVKVSAQTSGEAADGLQSQSRVQVRRTGEDGSYAVETPSKVVKDIAHIEEGADPLAATRLSLREVRQGMRLPRLKGTRHEAERILALVSPEKRSQALDFSANREAATATELSGYRYVHLATHGLVDTEKPELSGVVLSLVNEQGEPRDGLLLSHELYNLNLNAELVTISACQSGLGKQVKGEGIVGLTRGLMYAGAERVLVSLWAVDDTATAELMGDFYEAVLRRGRRPAEALRLAQAEMWKRGGKWRQAYYWAAFTLQGEWR
jgi:CHAT domain-containing protein